MTFEDYKRLDGLNASSLKIGYAKSLLHMRHVMTHESESTDAMTFGTFAHMAVLEPCNYALNVSVWRGGRCQGKEWEAFKLENERTAIIKADDHDRVIAVESAVRNCKFASDLINNSEHEVTLQWETKEYGKAKARVDGVCFDGAIYDLKTTSNIANFSADFCRMNYDLQMGWYKHGADSAKPMKRRAVYIIAVESAPPYDVAVYRVPTNALRLGYERAVKVALDYRKAERSGVWTGVQSEIGGQLEMPAWYESADDCDLDAIMPMDASEL